MYTVDKLEDLRFVRQLPQGFVPREQIKGSFWVRVCLSIQVGGRPRCEVLGSSDILFLPSEVLEPVTADSILKYQTKDLQKLFPFWTFEDRDGTRWTQIDVLQYLDGFGEVVAVGDRAWEIVDFESIEGLVLIQHQTVHPGMPSWRVHGRSRNFAGATTICRDSLVDALYSFIHVTSC